MVLVGEIVFIQLPNLPPAKHSRYTVLHVADKMTQTEDPEKIDCYVLVIPRYEYNILACLSPKSEAKPRARVIIKILYQRIGV